jgi:hypothetical protein
MLGLPRFEKMMFFEMREKFLEIRCDGLTSDTEFLAQLAGNLYFRAALFQKLEHPGRYEIQPEHLSVQDVEDDGTVLVMS